MSIVPPSAAGAHPHFLRARRVGVDTHQEAVVYMRADCHVCRSEGLAPHSRVRLRLGTREIIATLHHVTTSWIGRGEAGLSEIAWRRLDAAEGDMIEAGHPTPVSSLRNVRRRVYGGRIEPQAFHGIVSDVVSGRYSDVELSSFLTSCTTLPLDDNEAMALTRAMVDVGDRLSWPFARVFDKHSIGGLPGNRTTPIVVSIVAAHGLIIPKTSSRAITSPAGTADTMETMAPVDLDVTAIRAVVEREGGCIAWGGAVQLSPADDILIRIERALEMDSEGQLIASVLSKKIAAGATHLVIDMPVGPTAKVRSTEVASVLSKRLTTIAGSFGLNAAVVATDGSQPVGRGIGPALEAHEVLAVLQRHAGASVALRDRACRLAGALLELAGLAAGSGYRLAADTIDDGRAWTKFQRICEAQGGMRLPPTSSQRQPLLAANDGVVRSIDNRKIARLAKLAGAPEVKAAGVLLHVELGTQVFAGQPLCSVHADTPGELAYALEYAAANTDLIALSAS
jgi:thymidine phosphorylase